jgi:hypothetical protein
MFINVVTYYSINFYSNTKIKIHKMHYFRDKALAIINLLHVSAHVGHCQHSYTSHGTAGSSLAMTLIRRNFYEINYSQLGVSPRKSIAYRSNADYGQFVSF